MIEASIVWYKIVQAYKKGQQPSVVSKVALVSRSRR